MSILNSPIKIGDLTIKNRLVMPPMATAKATADGQVTKQICDYYHEIGRASCRERVSA